MLQPRKLYNDIHKLLSWLQNFIKKDKVTKLDRRSARHLVFARWQLTHL